MSVNPITSFARNSLSDIKQSELLALAANWECAKAAVENGADAIYFGLDKFNSLMPEGGQIILLRLIYLS